MINFINQYDDTNNMRSQIMISLFGECNMKCDFCFQRHSCYNDVKMTTNNINKVLNDFENVIAAHNFAPHISVSVIGGELFQSKFQRSYWKQLKNFFDSIKTILERRKISSTISVTTNAMFINDDVIGIIKDLDKVCLSYDLVGRFKSSNQLLLWHNNLNKLNEILDKKPIVEIISHKPNIESILNDDPHWKSIYSANLVEFNFLENGKGTLWEVTEQDLFTLFAFCLEHYPKIINVQYLINRYLTKSKSRTCSHGIIITPQTIKMHCCNRHQCYQQTIINKQCLNCKHWHYCGQTCFREFSTNSECYIRNFFDYYESWVSRQTPNFDDSLTVIK